ncbi:hypothetical protein Sjap_014524 [Stephania japonica]|uniref:Uncharacterized protein n=1 Tax=Stephania japonica TaxID=461633 RepID=A0AAP0IJB6_9MAGN
MDELKPSQPNSSPLTPLGFLDRAATVYGDCISVVYNTTSYTWSQTHRRCLQLASSLVSLGIKPGHVVSVLAPNIPPMYELHFAVPMSGAVLHTINTHLDARTDALKEIVDPPIVVLITDIYVDAPSPAVDHTYERLVEMGDPDFKWFRPKGEWDPMVLNYTSASLLVDPTDVSRQRLGLHMGYGRSGWNQHLSSKSRRGGYLSVDTGASGYAHVWRPRRAQHASQCSVGSIQTLEPPGPCFNRRIKDRSKDVINSGGEKVCCVEVESVLYSHPLIYDAAVVARPDEFWGETPCAFVSLKAKSGRVTEKEIIEYCRERMPHYMVPKSVVFKDVLPTTSTGKIKKFVLRDMAKSLGVLKKKEEGNRVATPRGAAWLGAALVVPPEKTTPPPNMGGGFSHLIMVRKKGMTIAN